MRFVLNRERAAKVAAGLLVAIALIVSLPSLMKSEQPEPLPPDVGLPREPVPLPVAPPPQPQPDPVAQRRAAKLAAAKRRREAREKARRLREKRERREKRHRRRRDDSESADVPVPAATYYAPSAGTREDFGFERP